MATETRHSGTLRTDLETRLARLDDFNVMECDRDRLLHRLVRGSEGTVHSLLENHVLTVLADIHRKRLDGYGGSFANAQGTAVQERYVRKLRHDMEGWVRRLEEYLRRALTTGSSESTAAQAASELRKRLNEVLPPKLDTGSDGYYKMLRTVTAIREDSDRYWQQAAGSGDTEPSLALLIAHLNNYTVIAEAFNRRLSSLPELYLKDILHAEPRAAEQDNAYVVVTPKDTAGGFTLKKGTAFTAGGKTVYRTRKAEYISPVLCMEVHAIHRQGETLSKATLLLNGDTQAADSLFPDGQPVSLGWQIESPMLKLTEGKRDVRIGFRLTTDSVLPDSLPTDANTLRLSGEEGWTEMSCRCSMEAGWLHLSFTMEQTDAATASCTEEAHGMETTYPVLRILTTQPRWASWLRFNRAEIRVQASGIRNFTLTNELGEADLTQAVLPFGIQAERGSRFSFHCKETVRKPLSEVVLKGRWQNLPATRQAFDARYVPYGVKSGNFTVSTACERQGAWYTCEDKQPLLGFDNEGKLSKAKVLFHFGEATTIDSFRITLESPTIGFGSAAYRKMFTEVMMHNSRCKEKDRKPMPEEPIVPQLCDMELAYTAVASIPLEKREGDSSCLSRIAPFLFSLPTEHQLLFAFTHAESARKVRMYIDMTLPESCIPFGSPQPDKQVRTSWEVWDGSEWQAIPSDSVKAEETNGFTQSGFVEIELPPSPYIDSQGRLWLRAVLSGDTSACLALRGVWTNCIRVKAENGDGTPLPAFTMKETEEADERIESIVQPLPGFGGRTAETEAQSTLRQQTHLHNRHRAVTRKDYEEIALELFPEIDKAQCVALPKENTPSDIGIVVFSRAEDNRYFLSPAWKLEEVRRTVSRYAPPFVTVRVLNPQYEKTVINCKAVLRKDVEDESLVIRQLTTLARNCIAPWLRTGEIPDSGDSFSYKQLHARLANHEALLRLVSLKVDGFSLPDTGMGTEAHYFKGSKTWSVLLPEIHIELLSQEDGIENAEIGGSFIIG